MASTEGNPSGSAASTLGQADGTPNSGTVAPPAPSIETVLGTVLHAAPWGMHMRTLRQVSREFRRLADASAAALRIPNVAELTEEQPAGPSSAVSPGHRPARCPADLLRLMPRLTALRQLECESKSENVTWLSDELGCVLGRLSGAAPEVMAGVTTLGVTRLGKSMDAFSGVESRSTSEHSTAGTGRTVVTISADATAAIAAALPRLTVCVRRVHAQCLQHTCSSCCLTVVVIALRLEWALQQGGRLRRPKRGAATSCAVDDLLLSLHLRPWAGAITAATCSEKWWPVRACLSRSPTVWPA